MRLVDTSAWVEVLLASTVGHAVAKELPERGSWLVPTIVQFELAKWLTRERSTNEVEQVIAFTETCQVVDLDSAMALAAAEVAARLRLTMADAVIYATADAYGADLLTCDAHFKDLPGVTYLPKAAH